VITVQNVSFSYGYEPVLQEVNFAVARDRKIGIVGPNGAGKSTLLKLLTQQEQPSEGKITILGKLAYVPQEVKKDPLLSAAQDIYEYIDPTGRAGKYSLRRVLDGLEFDWQKVTATPGDMSGGQKTKLALARTFLAEPDILLLDEPTNFLDEAGKKWVMHFLGNYKNTVLLISHDLALLDKHISQVLYVNPQTHTVDVYAGNYSKFVRTKKQRDESLTRRVETTQKKIQHLEKSVEKLRRQTSDKGVRQCVVLQRRVQRIKDALPEAPQELRRMKVTNSQTEVIREYLLHVLQYGTPEERLKILGGVKSKFELRDRQLQLIN